MFKGLRNLTLGVAMLSPLMSAAFAAEDDPVEKVRLAVGEADLVLGLIPTATEADPLLDKMCLRLGRFSAILRRIKGSTPPPPEASRINYVHYEHFCGWEPRPTDAVVENLLPRGFSSDASETLVNLKKLATQLKADRDVLDAWYKSNTPISCVQTIDETDAHFVTLKFFKPDLLKIQEASRNARFPLVEHKITPISFVGAPAEDPIFSCKKDDTTIIVWAGWVQVNGQYYKITDAAK